MARFTSIGMPRKVHVASTAEEKQEKREPVDRAVQAEAGPSKVGSGGGENGQKKRKRRGQRDKVVDGRGGSDQTKKLPGQVGTAGAGGWKRDPHIAKRARSNAERTESRREHRITTKHQGTTCFACRGIGHAARDCPNVLLAAAGGANAVEGTAAMLGDGAASTALQVDEASKGAKVTEVGKDEGKGMKRGKGKKGGEITTGRCYRCNATTHPLSTCPTPIDPVNPTPFATCYICLATGHLSSLCPTNPRGVYVKGGSCKVCGKVSHRAKDCPDDPRASGNLPARRDAFESESAMVPGLVDGAVGDMGEVGADEDDFMVATRVNLISGKGKDGKGKRKKHPPNNNGPREVYKGKADAVREVQGPVTVRAMEVAAVEEKVAAPAVSDVAALPPSVAPVAIAKVKSKPKVVKF